MAYKAKITFRDLQDNEYIYQVGEVYPREGYEPSKERVQKFLKKAVSNQSSRQKSLQSKSSKAKLDEAGIEYDAKAKKADLEELLKDAEEV